MQLDEKFFDKLANRINDRLDIAGEPEDTAREILVAASIICDAISHVLFVEEDDDAEAV